MSFQGLQERLTALQETTSQLRELIDRLANLEFQPGSVPLVTEEENSVSGELSAEIGQILRSGLDEQELLEEEVKYLRPEGHDKMRLKDGIQRLGIELVSSRSAFRKARLYAKKSLVQAQKLERELMIKSYSIPISDMPAPSPDAGTDEAQAPMPPRMPRHIHQQHQQSSLSEDDQQTVGKSSSVTNALRRTHDLIATELSRSEFAHQTLTESSDALKQLDESYGSLDSMLASSRDLLGTLLRSQKSDTWYLQTAFYMLLVTGAWLVFRRILYGPTWWLVWLPLRVIFGVGSKAGGAVMSGAGVGGAKKVKVGETDGKVPVKGLPNEDLPTAQVGQKVKTTAKEGEEDSMVEQVGKIVDAVNEADELESMPDGSDEGQEGKNTKKRMWEETQGVGGEKRPRDEL